MTNNNVSIVFLPGLNAYRIVIKRIPISETIYLTEREYKLLKHEINKNGV